MTDLVLDGARLLGLDRPLDMAVSDGVVTAVGRSTAGSVRDADRMSLVTAERPRVGHLVEVPKARMLVCLTSVQSRVHGIKFTGLTSGSGVWGGGSRRTP